MHLAAVWAFEFQRCLPSSLKALHIGLDAGGRLLECAAPLGARGRVNSVWRLSDQWRGQAREVEARACPLRQLQKTHGGVGVLPYLPSEQRPRFRPRKM